MKANKAVLLQKQLHAFLLVSWVSDNSTAPDKGGRKASWVLNTLSTISYFRNSSAAPAAHGF